MAIEFGSFGKSRMNAFIQSPKLARGFKEGATVWKIDPSTGEVLWSFNTQVTAWSVAANSAGMVYVGTVLFNPLYPDEENPPGNIWAIDSLDDEVDWVYSWTYCSTVRKVILDSSGNLYAAGSQGVIKLNSSGVKQWEWNPGGNGAYDVAVDSSGNVYATRGYVGTSGATLFKFNSAGVQQWAVEPDEDDETAHAYSVTVDDSGVVCGTATTDIHELPKLIRWPADGSEMDWKSELDGDPDVMPSLFVHKSGGLECVSGGYFVGIKGVSWQDVEKQNDTPGNVWTWAESGETTRDIAVTAAGKTCAALAGDQTLCRVLADGSDWDLTWASGEDGYGVSVVESGDGEGVYVCGARAREWDDEANLSP